MKDKNFGYTLESLDGFERRGGQRTGFYIDSSSDHIRVIKKAGVDNTV